MDRPKFKDGEFARYRRHTVRVVRCINLDDPQDKALQGHRYYIQVPAEKMLRSVPEGCLGISLKSNITGGKTPHLA